MGRLGGAGAARARSPSWSKSMASFRLARCALTASVARLHPSIVAASAGDRRSHASNRMASRSLSGRCSSAEITASLSSVPAAVPSVCAPLPTATPCASRADSETTRRSARRRLASTCRATPKSQGRGSAGMSSKRRHATRKVSATTSSASSGSARRSAYDRTTSACERNSRSNRASRSSGKDRPHRGRSSAVPQRCPARRSTLRCFVIRHPRAGLRSIGIRGARCPSPRDRRRFRRLRASRPSTAGRPPSHRPRRVR